jgi:hypothetical protein
MSDQCSNNQVFDYGLNKCISCRDLTVTPTTNYLKDPSGTSGLEYMCKNNTIKTYDNKGSIISQTCVSGETIDINGGTCNIQFWGNK